MKKLFSLLLALPLLLACGHEESILVTISNTLPLNRTGEMVELSMNEISERLQLSDTSQVVVLNAQGEQVPYQITHDDLLIFPATVEPVSTVKYTIQEGTPKEVQVKSCGKVYPDRLDDLAWENDLVGFRAYGPALQKSGQHGYGYDLFTKRGTTEPILEELYDKFLDKEIRAHISELWKTDRDAARELDNAISYHIDHGYGMDCYAVGPTLGAGTSALMEGDSLIYPWCYKSCEVLDNGPLRFTARLEFHPLTVGGDSTIVETRLISLDAGSQLNRTTLTYSHLPATTPIATGIVLHEPEGIITADAEKGYITYIDPTQGSDNGNIMIGCAFPAEVEKTKTVLFSPEEKAMRNNADGHLLAISAYTPAAEYIYYWGFAWNRAGKIKTPEAWHRYMQDFTRKVRTPLQVKM